MSRRFEDFVYANQPDAQVLAWVVFTGDNNVIVDGHLASSVTNDATGKWTITWERAISSSTRYAVMGTTRRLSALDPIAHLGVQFPSHLATTSTAVQAQESSGNTAANCSHVAVIAVGAP
jgi:hypothetical protein